MRNNMMLLGRCGHKVAKDLATVTDLTNIKFFFVWLRDWTTFYFFVKIFVTHVCNFVSF